MALFVALIFLVILTLLSITAMRTSTMELYMASNEQEHRIGLDSTQSASDAVIKNADIVVTVKGATTCIGFGYTPDATIDGNNCTSSQALPAGTGVGPNNFTQLTQLDSGTCPAFIATGERATPNGSSCSFFTLNNVYDATAQRGGRSVTVEGVVMEAY
ncbi:MAG TPA: pilus assembly PilX N-terminal domain-containing protein [Gammaproteobacteria bacterium]